MCACARVCVYLCVHTHTPSTLSLLTDTLRVQLDILSGTGLSGNLAHCHVPHYNAHAKNRLILIIGCGCVRMRLCRRGAHARTRCHPMYVLTCTCSCVHELCYHWT